MGEIKFIVKITELNIKKKFIKRADYVSMPKTVAYCDSKNDALRIETFEEANNLKNYLNGLTGFQHDISEVINT